MPQTAAPTSTDRAARVLTGFRPTGPLHVGHWAGNVGNAVRLQDEGYECFYFVADWHMLTTHYDRTETLPAAVEGLVLDLLAAGIDPERSVVYRQSDLPEVAEMALLLGMITPLGWLERVPTFKERLRDMAERDIANFGLLGYPVLQTVDIAIVRGALVPVGEDQVSHLEISREIVRRFNRLYGDVLVEPQALLSEWPLIPGSDGRKMSKSLDNTIDLADDPDAIRAKVRSFITDPQKIRRGDPGRPEICPVFALHRKFSPDILDWTEEHCRTGELGCVDCKTNLADRIIEQLPAIPRATVGAGRGSRSGGEGPRRWSRQSAPDREPDDGGRPRRDALRMSGDAGAPAAGDFAVELPVYAGPFRLLAELILEQKVDVCDVPVAAVTDRYLAYAKEAEGWNLEEATWFLAICAMLLELKVGRLMPRHTEPDEEDLLGASPDLAYARSLELAAFRRVAIGVARRLEDEAGFFARDVGPGPEFSHLYPDPLERVVPADLARVAAQLLRPPPTLDLSHVTPIRYSVEDAMTAVHERMAGFGGPASFRDLVADCADRIHVVVRFLAILELYREGKVELQQGPTFGEIEVEWNV